jgi:hypothetical protein
MPILVEATPAPSHAVARAPDSAVLRRDGLYASDVLDVAEGHALAIVIPRYYPADVCAAIADKLMAADELWTTYAPGTGAEHIGTLGKALFGCFGQELGPDCELYFAEAPDRNRALRTAVAPYLLPADRVQIELDQTWPRGATLLRIGGRPTFFGLCRFVSVGGGIEVHTDRADWDLPSPETSVLKAQLFENIYLSQAEGGGDLELWDIDVATQAEYDRLRSPTVSFALDRDLLPPPAVTIKVEPGTLVIANAARPHAVTPCVGKGRRLSVSGFIGFCGASEPLQLFS